MAEKGEMTCAEAGALGGAAVKCKYGRAFYERIGHLGGTATKTKYGRTYYSEIGTLGGSATSSRHGPEFFEEIGRKGGARMKRLLELGKQAEARKEEGEP